jgi:non-ribosomal peptide synthetase component F
VDRAVTRPALAEVARGVKALTDARILTPRVDHLVHRARALRAYGPVPAAGFAAAARAFPSMPYVYDEQGMLTFAEVDRRTDAIARALLDRGIRAGDPVGVLCRNGRAFVEAVLACSKVGATILFLNTDFAGPQLAGTLAREGGVALISDAEFDALLDDDALPGRRFIGFGEGDADRPALAELGRRRTGAKPAPPGVTGRLVILTSGTTGVPKGRRAHRRAAARGRRHPRPPALPRRAGPPHRRAALPRLGPAALHAGPGAADDDRPAPPLRPGGHAACDRRARRGVGADGPHHVAADHAAAERDHQQLRHVVVEGHPAERLGHPR